MMLSTYSGLWSLQEVSGNQKGKIIKIGKSLRGVHFVEIVLHRVHQAMTWLATCKDEHDQRSQFQTPRIEHEERTTIEHGALE